MRFRNLSDIECNARIWRELAASLNLSGPLPRAVVNHNGLYIGRILRVTFRPRLRRRLSIPGGTYTHGHISLFPCPNCDQASLIWVYLHELFHAWLHQREQQLYRDWSHCEKADQFTDAAYTLLGGRIRSRSCQQHKLSMVRAAKALPQFRALCSVLQNKSTGASLRRWSPLKEAERLTTRWSGRGPQFSVSIVLV